MLKKKIRPVSKFFSSETFRFFLLRSFLVVVFFFIAGYGVSKCVEEYFINEEMKLGAELSRIPSPEYAEMNIEDNATLKDFVAGNIFDLTVPEEPKEEEPEVDTSALGDYVLSGVMPGIGAWLVNTEKEGIREQTVLLLGDSFLGFSLSGVFHDRIVLSSGSDETVMFLRYAKLKEGTAKKETPKATPPVVKKTDVKTTYDETTKTGSISREAVNEMMMNPLAEMKRLRMRPRIENGNPAGIEIQWLDKNSVFSSLGVKQGDVVKSVNGVEIKNMGDVANVIGSLMNGDVFNVEVTRRGKTETLMYNIK